MPPEKREELRRATKLEWWTLFWMATVVLVIGLAMGSSQAMKTAWVEDILSLVPPIAFLVAARIRARKPTGEFPYGFHRVVSIAFLVSALALFSFGALLLFESGLTLVRREHPTIGSFDLFGRQIWAGWVMIGALLYSMIPPLILGHMKKPIAESIFDKNLEADSAMQRADWMTAGAGMVGVAGVGLGFWWADAAAALVIAFDVTRDGARHLRRVVSDLMDQAPTAVRKGTRLPVGDDVRDCVSRLPWVESADVRLREEGHLLTGEIFVLARQGESTSATRMREVVELARTLDWRLYDLVAMPVETLEENQK